MKNHAALNARPNERAGAEHDSGEAQASNVASEDRAKPRRASIRFVLEDGTYADEQPAKKPPLLKVLGGAGVAIAVFAFAVAPRLLEATRAEPAPVVAAAQPAPEKPSQPPPPASPAPSPELPALPSPPVGTSTSPATSPAAATTAAAPAKATSTPAPLAKSAPATGALAKAQPRSGAAPTVARASDNPYAETETPKPKTVRAAPDNPY